MNDSAVEPMTGASPLEHDIPFKIPAELSNTIESRAEVVLAQQSRPSQGMSKRKFKYTYGFSLSLVVSHNRG